MQPNLLDMKILKWQDILRLDLWIIYLQYYFISPVGKAHGSVVGFISCLNGGNYTQAF